MKIAICYPPLESSKGTPLLSQNRQFQWFTDKTTAYAIYPVIPASAATLLKSKGHKVAWLDGVAEKWSYGEFKKRLFDFGPDLVFMETKTPVVKKHWEIIGDIKTDVRCQMSDVIRHPSSNIKIVLVGDHVTAKPQESFKNSKVDYVLTGGDYDFALLNLVDHLDKKAKLEAGVYYREGGKVKDTGPFQLRHDLDSLPLIDRDLTRWKLYAYKNSNFKRTPGTYIMSGRDCWHGKCTFCSWTTLFPGAMWRARTPQNVVSEIEHLVKNFGVREIMDDAGTMPVGSWLADFCSLMIERGLNKKVTIDCNMRFNAGLTREDYALMGKAGFRFILYGLESASQKTLDRINKNLKVEQIEPVLTWAKEAGLEPHITVMVGYPWESREDMQATLDMAKRLFKKGVVDSMQATIVIPYPGTPLFAECAKEGWLKTRDWDRYDMREPIMKIPFSEVDLQRGVRSLYSAICLSPRFLIRKFLEVRSPNDIKSMLFSGLKFLAKLKDFKPHSQARPHKLV